MRLVKNILLSVLMTLFLGFDTKAQESDYGFWGMYVGTQYWSENWSTFTEFHWRDFAVVGEMEGIVARLAGQYDINPSINLSAGYAYLLSRSYTELGTVDRHEHRPYQQLLLRQKFDRVYLNHRYRLEQRIFEDDFRLRFRYFLQTNIVFNKRNMEKNAWYFSGYAELFLNTVSPIYDRLRWYAGLGYAITNGLRVELGNMAQVYETGQRHQLQLFIIHNLKLH